MNQRVSSIIGTLRRQKWLRFAVVGATSTVIDIIVLNLLNANGFNVYWAAGIAFLAGATNGYVWNSYLVFRQEKNVSRLTKYLSVSLVGLLLTEVIVHSLHVQAHLTINEAKLVAVAIVFFWNFNASKYWAFK